MKPGDHPEFFRLPPPEGRSRESSIVLTRDGRFFHAGAPVTHPGMHRAFASWLTRHPDDGRFILNNGYDWTYLTVEGPARFVQGVRQQGDQLALELLDGSELQLSDGGLLSDDDGRLWARLPEGALACFTPSAQLAVAPWLVEEGGLVGVRLGPRFSPIARLAPENGP